MVSGHNGGLNGLDVGCVPCVYDAEPIAIFNAGKAALQLKNILEMKHTLIFLVSKLVD